MNKRKLESRAAEQEARERLLKSPLKAKGPQELRELQQRLLRDKGK
jgi:hypothetical protein